MGRVASGATRPTQLDSSTRVICSAQNYSQHTLQVEKGHTKNELVYSIVNKEQSWKIKDILEFLREETVFKGQMVPNKFKPSPAVAYNS